MKRQTAVALAIVAATLVGAGVARKQLRWKRFAVVEPGVLYRSGMLKPWQLRQAIDAYGIKTVFSLTFTRNAEEEAVCREAGVERRFHYLSGDGVGPDDPYLAFLAVARDPSKRPLLVHCSAGVQRTGGAVALFRCVEQGWDIDRALAEMNAMGNDGNEPQRKQLRELVLKLWRPGDLAATGRGGGEQR